MDTSIVVNLHVSGVTLNNEEIKFAVEGAEVLSSARSMNQDILLDDFKSYLRCLRLKEFFADQIKAECSEQDCSRPTSK